MLVGCGLWAVICLTSRNSVISLLPVLADLPTYSEHVGRLISSLRDIHIYIRTLPEENLYQQSVRVQEGEDNIHMPSIGDVDDGQSERRPFLVANTPNFGKWPPTAASAAIADTPGYDEESSIYGSMARRDSSDRIWYGMSRSHSFKLLLQNISIWFPVSWDREMLNESV